MTSEETLPITNGSNAAAEAVHFSVHSPLGKPRKEKNNLESGE